MSSWECYISTLKRKYLYRNSKYSSYSLMSPLAQMFSCPPRHSCVVNLLLPTMQHAAKHIKQILLKFVQCILPVHINGCWCIKMQYCRVLYGQMATLCHLLVEGNCFSQQNCNIYKARITTNSLK